MGLRSMDMGSVSIKLSHEKMNFSLPISKLEILIIRRKPGSRYHATHEYR